MVSSSNYTDFKIYYSVSILEAEIHLDIPAEQHMNLLLLKQRALKPNLQSFDKYFYVIRKVHDNWQKGFTYHNEGRKSWIRCGFCSSGAQGRCIFWLQSCNISSKSVHYQVLDDNWSGLSTNHYAHSSTNTQWQTIWTYFAAPHGNLQLPKWEFMHWS